MEAKSKIMLEKIHEHLFPDIYMPLLAAFYISLSSLYNLGIIYLYLFGSEWGSNAPDRSGGQYGDLPGLLVAAVVRKAFTHLWMVC